MTDTAKILAFLKSQPMATISTVMKGSLQPESALIAFAQTDELELIFQTQVHTRKWENLQHNPHVAFVIGLDPKVPITLQYEGLAEAIPQAETEHYMQLFLAKDTPSTEKFLRDPRARLFKVKPQWIRLSDYTAKPVITEINTARS